MQVRLSSSKGRFGYESEHVRSNWSPSPFQNPLFTWQAIRSVKSPNVRLDANSRVYVRPLLIIVPKEWGRNSLAPPHS